MSFFDEILKVMLAHNTARFLLIWITITTAAAICVTLAVGQAAAPTSQKATKRPINLILTWREVATPRAVAALMLLAVFLASYIAMILAWEDFAYYDNDLFTLSTLKGHNFPLQISSPRGGRFLPLSGQEFSLIRHFIETITGYHVLPIVQLLIFFCILLFLDTELSITARAALAILALLTPSILTSFSGLIFDERNFLFYLVCLVLSVKRFELTQSIAWAVAAAVSAQIMIYYKETAFLLLLGFVTARLVLRCTHGHHAGWDYHRLWDKESRLDLCLASLGVLFLLYYFAEMGIHGNTNYAASARQPRAAILGYIRVDLLAWLFVAVVLGRIHLILSHRVPPLLLWDGLAVGGVVCFLAYLSLGIFSIYYLAPVDLIAILYVGRFAVLSCKKMRSWDKMAALLLAFIILLQDALVSAYAVFERKNVIHGKAEIASVVETRYRNVGNDLRLFFPFASPYVIMEFAAYLNYRGVPVEGAVGEAAGLNSVALTTPAVVEDGPCVEWVRIRCHAVSGPAPGDLVIVLPDDPASLAEASVYRERGKGELLFFYEPRPRIPDWLYSLFDNLYIGATRLRRKTNTDRWMDGSVTIW
jgi:hypothetical protein